MFLGQILWSLFMIWMMTSLISANDFVRYCKREGIKLSRFHLVCGIIYAVAVWPGAVCIGIMRSRKIKRSVKRD